jgi:hypothetical protein
MFLPMLAVSCRGCTRTRSPPTGGTLCGIGQRERKVEVESGETGRCFCLCWQGTAKAVQGHAHHLQEVHFVVGQRERKVEVESGRQVDVSAYVGRELRRLYKETLATRRHTLCTKCASHGRPERKESGERETGSISAYVGWEGDRGGVKENGREVFFFPF